MYPAPVHYDGAVRVSDFDFALPPELIAQAPPAERGTSRLLVLEKATGRLTHARCRIETEWRFSP